ncbi:hypothetical protein MNBD_GAMMA23-719 [hydrothermal vent metagenome]|uniref:Uncharacterized protein n=1 Tax=hydrothermal vent metagenome TaxID=652676 RepID=A0A3B1A1Z5_9ZZZZ
MNSPENKNSPLEAANENTDELLKQRLITYQDHINELPEQTHPRDRALLELNLAETFVGLKRGEEGWNVARAAFDVFLEHQSWQDAVEALVVLYQAEQPASIVALGQAAWLAVSFPISPETSFAVMTHLIDEMPSSADGAAVAAVVGQYVVDLRATDEEHENLSFLTRNVLVKVAELHSGIKSQKELDIWRLKLELNEPEKFLPRMSLVIGAIVEDNWWFDRDKLRELMN